MIECTVFVYKHTFCSKGDLIIGNNGYEILYEPKQSKSALSKHNTPRNPHTPPPELRSQHAIQHTTPSPSASANSSNFLLSFIDHLSPSVVSETTDILHRIVIDWDTISGLQRINKQIKYNKNDTKNTAIELKQQLIIESTSYPTLHIMEYNRDTFKYETKSVQSLRTHYIGLEYDIIHSHDVLLGNNYHRMKSYNFLDAFDINEEDPSLLEQYPQYSLFINHSLPKFIWIPLLNHTLRVFIENAILFGNISLFIWTIYQMTKYTSIIKGFYEHVFYPLFIYISKPILNKMYYCLNLMHFHVVMQVFGNIFNLLYNYIPINFLYQVIAFLDQHIMQQIISLFTMFYRLFVSTSSIFVPVFNSILFAFKQCFGIIDWHWIISHFDCMICKRIPVICDSMKCICDFARRCCRLCQRSQTLNDSSTKLLKAGVRVMNAENTMSENAEAASSICGAIGYICDYLRGAIDVFWVAFGKPIKHSYDFFRYIRSEVGVVVAICIRKICRKSKAKIKIAGKKVLEEAKNSIIKTQRKKDTDKGNLSDSAITEQSDQDITYYRDALHEKQGLRFRGEKRHYL